MGDGALVLFSGGQDSTVCVAWALRRYKRVETIGFDYDQRHHAELTQRPIILADIRSKFPELRDKMGEDRVVKLDVFKSLVASELLDSRPQGTRPDGLPATFVPGRNLFFLLVAAIVAKERGIKTLVGGMCETDFSGYPDCRDDTIKAFQVAMNLGLLAKLTIETPLMRIDKAQTWSMAYELGGSSLVNTIVNYTHTCYENDRTRAHGWGLGCGACAACKLRAKGWIEYEKRAS